MTESELTQMLKRAAATENPSAALDRSGLMRRLHSDDGRARRWRVFIQLMLAAALLAGVITAILIGWSMAMRDDTHDTPPPMSLFREGAPL